MGGNSEIRNTKKIRTITGLGVLTAVVVILQLFGSGIRFGPFSISLVNVPLAIGGILYGISGGLWLGFIFGMVVLLSGDASLFLVVSIPGTILTVLAKGMAAGMGAAFIYRLLKEKSRTFAYAAAAIACPVLNTDVFLIGCLLFFQETIRGWAAAAGAESLGTYMLVGFVGTNFLVELIVSAVLTPVVIRLLGILRKKTGADGDI